MRNLFKKSILQDNETLETLVMSRKEKHNKTWSSVYKSRILTKQEWGNDWFKLFSSRRIPPYRTTGCSQIREPESTVGGNDKGMICSNKISDNFS